jgi:RNA polymerase sigma factor (sigma-70 family)
MRDSHLWLVAEPGAPGPPDRPERALGPALPRNGPIPPAIDHRLGLLAHRARHESETRNVLYAAFLPRLDYWVKQTRNVCFRDGADLAIEPEDVEQQAFIVFSDLIDSWDGNGSISSYLFAYFRWRLSDAVRRMSDPRRHIQLDRTSRYLRDGSHLAGESLSLLEAIAADLPSRQGLVLLLRLRDGLPWSEIASQIERDIRTAQRDWNDALHSIRSSMNIRGRDSGWS